MKGLIVAIIVIAVITVITSVVLIFNSKSMVENIPVDNNILIENKEETDNTQLVDNTNMENTDTDYDELISEYLSYIWSIDEIYNENIPEFQDIKNAPKEYLAGCTSMAVMRQLNGEIYDAKVDFSEFNNMLVKLFGKKADGLLVEADLDSVFFVVKNADGTYHFVGFGPSDTLYRDYYIKSIKNEDNKFYVDLCEYVYNADGIIGLDENVHQKIYDRKGNLVVELTPKIIDDEGISNIISVDEAGNEINNIKDFLAEKYEDKLSVRHIVLEKVEDSFVIISNELEK